MEEAVRTGRGFIWFLDQSITVGGLGFFWFFLPCAALLALAIWRFPKHPRTRRRLLWLGLLPLVWIFVGLWGAYFWLDWQNAQARYPAWLVWPADGALPAAVFLSVVLFASMKGARVFTAAFAALNLYFTLSMSLLARMAVTGHWL